MKEQRLFLQVLLGVVLASVMCLSVAGQSSRPVAQPLPDPAIAYEAYSGTAIKLMVMNADGSNQTGVITQGRNRMPSWSPGGSQLTFVGTLQGTGIYIVNKDGTGLCKLVVTNQEEFVGPVWSPLPLADGKYRIVYADIPTGATQQDLFAVNADCQNPGAPVNLTSTTSTREWFPSWSRFANRIAAQVDLGQGPEIVIYDVGVFNGILKITSQTRLKDLGLFLNRYAAEPDWGKADDRIALEANLPTGEVGDIWVTDLTTAGTFNLTSTPNVHEVNPSWSPDGSEIVFRRQPFSNGQFGFPVGLYKLNLVTGTLTKLVETGRNLAGLRYPDWRRCNPCGH